MTLQFSRLPASSIRAFSSSRLSSTACPACPPRRPSPAWSVSPAASRSRPRRRARPCPSARARPSASSAQGARAYQWRKDGIAIAGATGTSYTTPPIQGADSGSLYDVVVSGPCASATSAPAVLTVADSTPPVAAVVAPSGGEYLLLSPATGPASTEQVAWSMSDNVRVCQVRVSLLYSNDGGVVVSAGARGRRSAPGVRRRAEAAPSRVSSTTNLTYSVPTTLPLGQVRLALPHPGRGLRPGGPERRGAKSEPLLHRPVEPGRAHPDPVEHLPHADGHGHQRRPGRGPRHQARGPVRALPGAGRGRGPRSR